MFRDDFIQASGGVFRSHKSWSRLSSDDKYREFWAFFDRPDSNTRSIYTGVSVQQLLQHGHHSVEHIVPRSLLEFELAQAPKTTRRGATVNPLNFAASHRKANTHRGHVIFDFDDDEIRQRTRLNFHTISTENTGLDRDGEWIVPPRTRGDIARAVIYMFLLYPLPRLRKENASALLKWHSGDRPSKWEKQYNAWVLRRKHIQNPLIGTSTQAPLQFDNRLLMEALVG